VVNYPVVVKITDADGNIRPGMTASVTITVDQRNNVLMAPNKAIRTSNGQQTVTVLFEGQQIAVPVTVGLAGDTMSEITSEQLREGDTVVINGSTASGSALGERDIMFFGGPGDVGTFRGGPPGGMP
jgi:multidrug efflux pump subunit AcrA (membrane-fusion protein)